MRDSGKRATGPAGVVDPRRIAFALAGIRLANGLVLLLAPQAAEVAYLGPRAGEPTARALSRFTGVRELALAVGAVVAIRARRADAEAVAAGALCDGIDAAISLVSPGLALRTRLAAPTAAASAVAGLWVARELARARRVADVSSKRPG